MAKTKPKQESFSENEEREIFRIENLPLNQLPYEILPDRALDRTEFMFKLIVIGDSATGKSCLMHRLCHNEFNDDHEVTVGVEFGSLFVRMRGSNFKMQIWDTAGQESFQSITKIFYRGAHAVFLTYDVTALDSYMNL